MSSFSLHDKVTGHEIKAWYLSSLEIDGDDGDAAWESFMDHKPEDFKAPKKSRVSKKSSTPAERSDAPYNEDKCDARVYKGPSKGGWGCQCSCKKVDGQTLCKRHQTEADGHGGMVKNGFVTGDRPTHHYGDESSTLISWHDVEVPTKVKKKTSGEKKVSTRKCSCCGETGHNKRNCPNKSDSDSDTPNKNKKNNIAEMKAELAKAEAAAEAEAKVEVKEVVGKKNKKNKKNKKKKSKNSVKVAEVVEVVAATELDEDDDTTLAYGGEEIVEDKTETYAGDVGNMDDVKDEDEDEDEDEKGEDIEFKFEGVSYTRNTKSSLVCDDDFDEVGTWNNESQSIIWGEDGVGEKAHKHDEDYVEEEEDEEEEEEEE